MVAEKQFAGRYDIIEPRIGVGSFGEVYRAYDNKFKPPRLVAIKIIKPSTLENSTSQYEIETEAGYMARFRHPNILRILDYEFTHDLAYIVMDLAEGGSLQDRIRPRDKLPIRLPLREVVYYIGQIAAALNEAHSQGIIHRDLKPGNILLDRNGNVLLSDFGLAAVVSNATSTNIEAEGGTPLYMAPEQWKGKPRRSSDIYALGVITYQLITAKTPYTGSKYDLMRKHIEDPIPTISQAAPDLVYPPELDEIIASTLEKDYHLRLASAEAFYNRLYEVVVNMGIDLTPLNLPPLTPVFSNTLAVEESSKPETAPSDPFDGGATVFDTTVDLQASLAIESLPTEPIKTPSPLEEPANASSYSAKPVEDQVIESPPETVTASSYSAKPLPDPVGQIIEPAAASSYSATILDEPSVRAEVAPPPAPPIAIPTPSNISGLSPTQLEKHLEMLREWQAEREYQLTRTKLPDEQTKIERDLADLTRHINAITAQLHPQKPLTASAQTDLSRLDDFLEVTPAKIPVIPSSTAAPSPSQKGKMNYPPNPFTGSARLEGERFIPPDRFLRKVRNRIEKASIYLYGEPLIGKSSILWTLYKEQAQLGHRAIWCDLNQESMPDLEVAIAKAFGLATPLDWRVLYQSDQPLYLFIDNFDRAKEAGFNLDWGRRFRAFDNCLRLVIAARQKSRYLVPHPDNDPDSEWYNLLVLQRIQGLTHSEGRKLLVSSFPPELATRFFPPEIQQKLLEMAEIQEGNSTEPKLIHPFKLTLAARHYYDEKIGNGRGMDWHNSYYTDLNTYFREENDFSEQTLL
jgi:serine/threonine protein kinase